MKNKHQLKKYLLTTCIICIGLIIIFLMIHIYEYYTYNKNFNYYLSAIVSTIKDQYPNIQEEKIMEILNSTKINSTIFEKYSIDIDKNSIILENEKAYHSFLILNISFLFFSILLLIILFLKYNQRKDKQISEITRYIEEINRKNYTLHINEISEDELSILKNEIYKTTIMLKESAENSLKDKKELKKSLEDISHQLKTPLTSILVILDNLIDDIHMDNNTREEFIRDIKREIVNIHFLVQAILKLSKFDSNTIEYLKEKNLVKDILTVSIKNVATLCDLKNINIKIKGNSKIKLNCDFKWQVEAITNILKNCIEHSKNDNQIIVEYTENNAYILICIQDFGEGISEKDLPHIFERFYKGENSTTDSIGIGLALSKTIIEKENGKINVESNCNGTKFEIKYYKYS